ncbi:hypothetical protein AAMO2058_000554100 [Amorphochlora amoebiformis]|uniref:Uncharacterized protein n=1 Tax=Amorphochlora amoebiformis TaxID=1561963 RepID=A0A7S0GRP1_9EUKA|mmetsp:Transcript_13165/g.20885  ORF Transcript_13165/g.20885 Transcript_13165/m.20885 type:complete len:330 (+) Transcript_13165:32-1021(+)
MAVLSWAWMCIALGGGVGVGVGGVSSVGRGSDLEASVESLSDREATHHREDLESCGRVAIIMFGEIGRYDNSKSSATSSSYNRQHPSRKACQAQGLPGQRKAWASQQRFLLKPLKEAGCDIDVFLVTPNCGPDWVKEIRDAYRPFLRRFKLIDSQQHKHLRQSQNLHLALGLAGLQSDLVPGMPEYPFVENDKAYDRIILTRPDLVLKTDIYTTQFIINKVVFPFKNFLEWERARWTGDQIIGFPKSFLRIFAKTCLGTSFCYEGFYDDLGSKGRGNLHTSGHACYKCIEKTIDVNSRPELHFAIKNQTYCSNARVSENPLFTFSDAVR